MAQPKRKQNHQGPVHISKILPVVLDDILRRAQARRAREHIEKQEPNSTFVALALKIDTTVN